MVVLEPGHVINRPGPRPEVDPSSLGDIFPSLELSPRGLVLPEGTQCVELEGKRKEACLSAWAARGVAAYLAARGDDTVVQTIHAQSAEIELVQPAGVFVDSPQVRDMHGTRTRGRGGTVCID